MIGDLWNAVRSLLRTRRVTTPAVIATIGIVLGGVTVIGLVVVGVAAAALPGQQPPPTFKSGVDLVMVDVSVVAKSGVPVNDLAPGDFTVVVDGRPRTVTSAQFVAYDVRTTTARERATVATPAVGTSPPPPPRLLLIAVDEDSLETGEGLVAKQAASKFLDRLAPNDRAGVVAIPRLRSPVQVSTKRSDAKKALDAIIPGINRDPYEFNVGLAEAVDIERGFTDVLQRVARRECRLPEDADWERALTGSCPLQVKRQCRQMVLQTRLRTQRSLDALALLADALTGVDGPKTVVLISGGLTLPDESPGAAYSRLEAAFGAAQITLYTVFLERSSLFGQVQYTPSPSAMDDDRMEMAGIENATSAVGGTLMLGIGTLDQSFDRVITELSGSSLLGIDVAEADRDGRPHLVDVKVNRPGLEVARPEALRHRAASHGADGSGRATEAPQGQPASASASHHARDDDPGGRGGGGPRRRLCRGLRDGAVRAGRRGTLRTACVQDREARGHVHETRGAGGKGDHNRNRGAVAP